MTGFGQQMPQLLDLGLAVFQQTLDRLLVRGRDAALGVELPQHALSDLALVCFLLARIALLLELLVELVVQSL